jgi:hypothetical protein
MEILFKRMNYEDKKQAKSLHKFDLEKVYGDFKRMHSHIIESFQNELKEYERVESIMQTD